MKIIDIARICHEANRAHCENMGDFSQVSWENAPEIIKNSAIFGVTSSDMTPEETHRMWMDYKLAEGWVWGTEKNVLKKNPLITYPLLRTF